MAHHHQHQHYRSPFGDTTLIKVFVGGLAWETTTEVMRSYFDQFGEILEAVIIVDKTTGKSKGYGFVTFRDPESARRACVEPNPVIDGRRANCNIASLGRHGTNQTGIGHAGSLTSFPPPQPPPSVVYPPYGYTTYRPAYQGIMYNRASQYYNQLYGTSSSSSSANPYYYGYIPTFSINPQGVITSPYLYHPSSSYSSLSYQQYYPFLQPRSSINPATPNTSTGTEIAPTTSTA